VAVREMRNLIRTPVSSSLTSHRRRAVPLVARRPVRLHDLRMAALLGDAVGPDVGAALEPGSVAA
jgi:hypothetical protein